jgi:hypothetical protein
MGQNAPHGQIITNVRNGPPLETFVILWPSVAFWPKPDIHFDDAVRPPRASCPHGFQPNDRAARQVAALAIDNDEA